MLLKFVLPGVDVDFYITINCAAVGGLDVTVIINISALV